MAVQRGFKAETLNTMGFFSVTAEDLPALGVTVPFDKLPSTIAAPYLSECANGLTLARIHKTSAEGFEYPPYLTPVPTGNSDIVITESEIKAAMVFQLGDQGVGLQGTYSFLKRVPVLANAIRSRVNQGAFVYVLPDHERLIVDGKLLVYEPTIQMIRLAHGLSLDLGCSVKVITLPDEYMEKSRTHTGEPKMKADLDGCVVKGMTQDDWRKLKENAKQPWEMDVPVACIVEAMASANAEEFLTTTNLKPRTTNLSVDDSCAVCRALAGVLARKCQGQDGNFDKARFELYKKSAVEWAKKNGLKNVNTKTFHITWAGNGDTPKEDLIAHCMKETELGIVLVKKGTAVEVVAPFQLESAKYGLVHYIGAPKTRRYEAVVKIVSGGKPSNRRVVIDGNLYDCEAYTKADPDLGVANPKHFRMYTGAKLLLPDFQAHTPELDTPLFVGLVREEVRVFALAQVKFPNDHDCWYDCAQLSDSGDANKSFQEIAAISTNADSALAHLLGAPLKAALGAYPHSSWVGARYAGKTTIAKEVCERTGLRHIDADKQLTTRYRQLRAVGNHNLAVFIDEAPRLPVEAAGGMLATLNACYNGSACTHGRDGYYQQEGCAVLLGQDRPFTDEALDTKQVITHFAREALKQEALRGAIRARTKFPFTAWLQYLAANCDRAQTILNEKQVLLRGLLSSTGVNPDSPGLIQWPSSDVKTKTSAPVRDGAKPETGNQKPLSQPASAQSAASARNTTALPKEMSLDLGGGVKMEMVLIKAGEFMMGEKGVAEPVHPVKISKPFYMGQYHVTQEQYEAMIGKNPAPFKGPKNPVEQVSWDDAQEFCKIVSQKAGKTVRLPTEAEWEYACRAGTTTKFNLGDKDSDLERAAWFNKNSGGHTNPVGQKEPNAFGLYDMHGNVWQWVQDYFSDKYYVDSPPVDPKGPANGGARVLRGGGWACAPLFCLAAYRGRSDPGGRTNCGFRCALEYPPLIDTRGEAGKPDTGMSAQTHGAAFMPMLGTWDSYLGEFILAKKDDSFSLLEQKTGNHSKSCIVAKDKLIFQWSNMGDCVIMLLETNTATTLKIYTNGWNRIAPSEDTKFPDKAEFTVKLSKSSTTPATEQVKQTAGRSNVIEFPFKNVSELEQWNQIEPGWTVTNGALTCAKPGLNQRIELVQAFSGNIAISYDGATQADMGLSFLDGKDESKCDRVIVGGMTGDQVGLAATGKTKPKLMQLRVADGKIHHVEVVRKEGALALSVDGKQVMELPASQTHNPQFFKIRLHLWDKPGSFGQLVIQKHLKREEE
ncbi:MAG: SUMF1/EgtB/PvdO family nonheme iron enzyme [Planctomycetota bacterium]